MNTLLRIEATDYKQMVKTFYVSRDSIELISPDDFKVAFKGVKTPIQVTIENMVYLCNEFSIPKPDLNATQYELTGLFSSNSDLIRKIREYQLANWR